MVLAFATRQWHRGISKCVNLGLRLVSLALRGEQPQLTAVCPCCSTGSHSLVALRATGHPPANLHSAPAGNLQPFVLKPNSLTGVRRVPAFHKAKTEEKEGRAQVEPCLSDKSVSILLQVKVFGTGSCGSSPSLIPLQIRDTI